MSRQEAMEQEFMMVDGLYHESDDQKRSYLFDGKNALCIKTMRYNSEDYIKGMVYAIERNDHKDKKPLYIKDKFWTTAALFVPTDLPAGTAVETESSLVTKPKFKAGDIVILKRSMHMSAPVGAKAKVISEDKYLNVVWLDREFYGNHTQHDGGYTTTDFELAPPEQQYKFKVGDYVIGNEKADRKYSFTVKGYVGYVCGVSEESFAINKMDNIGGDRNYYGLDYECFDLISKEDAERIYKKETTPTPPPEPASKPKEDTSRFRGIKRVRCVRQGDEYTAKYYKIGFVYQLSTYDPNDNTLQVAEEGKSYGGFWLPCSDFEPYDERQDHSDEQSFPSSLMVTELQRHAQEEQTEVARRRLYNTVIVSPKDEENLLLLL